MPREPLEVVSSNIPVLTEVIRNTAGPTERDTLIAELQTELAARTYALADELLRAAFASMEATLFEQISTRLRSELPELIDATLREHLETEDNDQGRS